MKKIIITISTLLILSNSYAVSLNDALETLDSSGEAGAPNAYYNQMNGGNENEMMAPKNNDNITSKAVPKIDSYEKASNKEEAPKNIDVSEEIAEQDEFMVLTEDEALDDQFGQIDIQLQEINEAISNNITTNSVLQKEIKKIEKNVASSKNLSLLISGILLILVVITLFLTLRVKKMMNIKLNDLYANISNNNMSAKIEDLEAKIAYINSTNENIDSEKIAENTEQNSAYIPNNSGAIQEASDNNIGAKTPEDSYEEVAESNNFAQPQTDNTEDFNIDDFAEMNSSESYAQNPQNNPKAPAEDDIEFTDSLDLKNELSDAGEVGNLNQPQVNIPDPQGVNQAVPNTENLSQAVPNTDNLSQAAPNIENLNQAAPNTENLNQAVNQFKNAEETGYNKGQPSEDDFADLIADSAPNIAENTDNNNNNQQ
jgi:hypothetical protein